MKLAIPLFVLCFLAAPPPTLAQIGTCDLPPDPGPCEALITRWYHNAATGQCETFIYGGCEGNANNFETLIECQQACVDICSLPPDPGPCKALIPRWYHNAATGQCEEFIYGGCEGNANNFETKLACEQACLPVCTLPPDVGPCDGVFPRWYFDTTTGQCEQFIYGGCEGNGNNFETLEACQAACVVPGLVEHYSCVNPTDSLVILSGGPLIGTSYTVGVDNPIGTSVLGSAAFVAVATLPDPSFPCGTPVPGFGMVGPFGEILLDVLPPNPFRYVAGESLWLTPGDPAPVVLTIPANPGLVGQVVHLQGFLAGAGSAKLTEGQRLTIAG